MFYPHPALVDGNNSWKMKYIAFKLIINMVHSVVNMVTLTKKLGRIFQYMCKQCSFDPLHFEQLSLSVHMVHRLHKNSVFFKLSWTFFSCCCIPFKTKLKSFNANSVYSSLTHLWLMVITFRKAKYITMLIIHMVTSVLNTIKPIYNVVKVSIIRASSMQLTLHILNYRNRFIDCVNILLNRRF